MTPQELLRRALDPATDENERYLLVAAAISLATGQTFVLVGGAATNLHMGSYRPTDVDLVGPRLRGADEAALTALGFKRRGRHLVLRSSDGLIEIPVEFPGSRLFSYMKGPNARYEIRPGTFAEVAAVTDLMMDRVVKATDGTPSTLADAVGLAVAAYREIDWDELELRAKEESIDIDGKAFEVLEDTLKKVRRQAVALIRRAREPRES